MDKLDKQLTEERGRLEQIAGESPAQTPADQTNQSQSAATQASDNVASETEETGGSGGKRKTQTASTLCPQS